MLEFTMKNLIINIWNKSHSTLLHNMEVKLLKMNIIQNTDILWSWYGFSETDLLLPFANEIAGR